MRFLLAIFALFVFLAPAQAQNWQLVWADEFNGAANSAPDQAKWGYDLGNNNGWGNHEWETYTNSTDNAFLDGRGNLVIRAIRTGDVTNYNYTSARLKTQGKFSFTYGKIEARMKLPFGQGIWPAFWMLGTDIGTTGWPGCGEVDIMENIGKLSDQSTTHATIHGPGYSGSLGIGGTYTLPVKLSDDFHTYAAVWTPDSIEFFIDGISFKKILAASITNAGKAWVFNKPFFIIMNLAVGGNWPGYPDNNTQFPQSLVVDYVRVWRDAGNAPTVGGITNAASYACVMSPGSLATLWGVGMSDATADALFDPTQNAFRTSAAGAEVRVNGVAAPLTYVSPGQINFQVPWETPTGADVPVQVSRSGTTIDAVPITFVPAAPSAFLADIQKGLTILTCPSGAPQPGDWCTLWGNGFGAKKTTQQNGAPSTAPPYPDTVNSCSLQFGDIQAEVQYCGGAPGQIIDQLNFKYPAGIPGTSDTVTATLTISGISGQLLLPAAR